MNTRILPNPSPYVTADLQSAVIFICGFVIRSTHVDDSDYKSEQAITPDYKSSVTQKGKRHAVRDKQALGKGKTQEFHVCRTLGRD